MDNPESWVGLPQELREEVYQFYKGELLRDLRQRLRIKVYGLIEISEANLWSLGQVAILRDLPQVLEILINEHHLQPEPFLVQAVIDDRTNLVRLLLELGADPSYLDNQALIEAVKLQSPEVIDLLLEDERTDPATALWAAVSYQDLPMFRHLLQSPSLDLEDIAEDIFNSVLLEFPQGLPDLISQLAGSGIPLPYQSVAHLFENLEFVEQHFDFELILDQLYSAYLEADNQEQQHEILRLLDLVSRQPGVKLDPRIAQLLNS